MSSPKKDAANAAEGLVLSWRNSERPIHIEAAGIVAESILLAFAELLIELRALRCAIDALRDGE